jgi:hypothetical protein
MKGFGGPLTEDWMEQRKALNLKMLRRMRGLGMTPALPAFAGHVPLNFTKLFPHANFTRSPDWSNFDLADTTTAAYADDALLETTDPLFVEVGSRFLKLQARVYGTDHIYQTDIFNEMAPPTNDTGYLARSSKNTYAAMSAGDPDAIWLMQAWLFTDGDFWRPPQIKAYLSGVATERLWLLDLSGDSRPFWSQTESFAGHPFILCTLLNFGGQQGLNGNVNRMALGVQAAVREEKSTIVGVGVTMEGIWQNYPLYEATLQQAWKHVQPQSATPQLSHDASCGFAPALAGVFLAGYPESLGCDPWLSEKGAHPGRFGCDGRWPYNRSDLTSAQAWCCAHDDCGGVTLQYGLYEARSGGTAFKGGGGNASSYLRLNAKISTLGRWFEHYGTRRYGRTDPSAVAAWRLLGGTIYGGIGGGFGSPISSVPTLPDTIGGSEPSVGLTLIDRRAVAANLAGSYGTPLLTESSPGIDDGSGSCGCCQVCACGCAWDAANDAVTHAWGLLVAASDTLAGAASFRFDLVDVGRYVIGGKFLTLWQQYSAAFAQRNVTACTVLQMRCMEMIDDYDSLLSTDANFQLGRWQNWSRSWGGDRAATDNLEYNARNQLTLWGPSGQIVSPPATCRCLFLLEVFFDRFPSITARLRQEGMGRSRPELLQTAI